MPVRKQEAYRALELLEEYYNRLESPDDQALKDAIDRVIKVFKSRLFQALIDIQEFYESILLDEQSDRSAKVSGTHRLANEWEHEPMLKRNVRNETPPMNQSSTIEPLVTTNPISRPSEATDNRARQATPTPFSRIPKTNNDSINTDNRPTTAEITLPIGHGQFSYVDHWREISINLERPSGTGLGFSIAGGSDIPCISDSPAVFVTRVTEGGLAHLDGRLKLHDIILRVNEIDFTNIEHQLAVDSLREAGSNIKLLIRRLEPKSIQEIELIKPVNAHLGFSIAGGITHEHVKGDHGIFITNIIPGGVAAKEGSLQIGDRLMEVLSQKNTYDLRFVEHKHAVESIRRACDEGAQLKLYVGHVTQNATNMMIKYNPIAPNLTNGHQTAKNDRPEESTGERRVTLVRGVSGFGFNIVGGQNKIFVTSVQSGSAAERLGQLRKGDQILSINNTDMHGVTHEEAAAILKNCGDAANLQVIHRYDDFLRLKTPRDEHQNLLTKDNIGSASNIKTLAKRQFYVQTEFDYDPTKDISSSGNSGLLFRKGDILHVINAADDNWWQAKRVIDGQQDDGEVGIIPSKSRIEKKERARQKRVNFNPENTSRNNTLDRDKKRKKKFGLFNKTDDKRDALSAEDSDNEPENFEHVASYTLVGQHELDYTRPVIIFGPFKDILNDQFLSNQPERFVNCVPHTSRQKRDKEVDGRDYHFASSREQMERDIHNYRFIEAGEYGGNLYGTSVNAVQEVANSGKHCVLDVSGSAIRRLIGADLHPIVIYIKARDIKWILNNMGTEADEARAQQMLEKSLELEQQFGDLFTVVIEEENLGDIYVRVAEVIDGEQARDYLWVPSKEKF